MNKDITSILTKRFQTTMIGALYEFEQTFGYLWGQQKEDESELTEKELKFLDIWEDARNRVLNNGNNQLRKCSAEVKKYLNTDQVKYSYNFKMKGQ
jgi:hypothetical protein